MPRPPRVHVPGGVYHLTLRGDHRESLFGGADDREKLNEIVSQVIAKLRAQVHCFCWMNNHLHFVMQVSSAPTGKVMQRIAMRYSRYRHRRLFMTGHLFERRYWAKLVEDDVYFMQLLRYIHFNPVEPGLVYDAAEYRWSSHRSIWGVSRFRG